MDNLLRNLVFYTFDKENGNFISEFNNSTLLSELVEITDYLKKENIEFEIIDTNKISILNYKENKEKNLMNIS